MLDHEHAALAYAARDWPVFPCRPRGKEPLTEHGFKDATTDEQQIRAWWRRWPDANIGIATGAQSFLVIDVDPRNGGDDALRLLERQNGPLPETVVAQTGGGGRHLCYRCPDGQGGGKLADGIDVKANGGYIVAPPSIHPNGHSYTWLHHPDDVPLADPPAWLLALLRAPKTPMAPTDGDRIPTGQRNTTLTSLAGSMRRRGMTPEAIEAALLTENASRCDPPLAETEVRAIARSIARYAPEAETLYLTDLGNARRFARQHKAHLRYCAPLRGWFFWDGRRWAHDDTGMAYTYAKQTVISILQEAIGAQDDHTRERLAKWGITSQSTPRIEAMLRLAQSEPELVARPSDFDADPMLFNCQNGTLDLRTGELRPHDPGDMLTKLAGAEYHPGATHPVWQHYLADATGGDAGLAAYLQRAAGYSLTGRCDEESIFLVLGDENTGKSTFAEALLAVLGDYGAKIAFEALLERGKFQVGGPRPDIVRLVGKRYAVACEASGGGKLDAVLLKELTGRDSVTVRDLYSPEFTFRTQFKLWMATNKSPQIDDRDGAIWRRLRRVPFERIVPKDQRDPMVKTILVENADAHAAILAWAVQGCLAWQRDGLGMPDIIDRKTNELRASFDPLARFVAECCRVSPEAEVRATALREAYNSWLAEVGGDRCPEREWSARLEALGARRVRRGGKRLTVWRGIGLIGDEG